ncbi:hypothetical protein MRX96_010942 [Rhipicephalus microplus]
MQGIVRTLVIIGLVGKLAVPTYSMVHASVPAVRGTMALAFLTSCFVGGSTFLCEKIGGACKYNTDCCHRLVCLQVTQDLRTTRRTRTSR